MQVGGSVDHLCESEIGILNTLRVNCTTVRLLLSYVGSSDVQACLEPAEHLLLSLRYVYRIACIWAWASLCLWQ